MKVLITADWHIKGERPICRLDDDWIASQRKTISEIREAFSRYGCDQIWILGDLFDAPRCSTEAVNMLVEELLKFPEGSVRVLCGNHDLKDHNYYNLNVCSIGTIKQIFGDIPDEVQGNISRLTVSARPFGMDDYDSNASIVCTHQLTFPDDATRGIFGGSTAEELLSRWPRASIIFTGDYHHGYVHSELKDNLIWRYVVTPGCINIQKADELDYEPFVVLWDTEADLGNYTFKKIYLDPQAENCTRDHIEAREHKEEEFERVVETIKGNVDISLDFDSNLEAQVQKTDSAIIGEYNIMRQTINGEGK